MTKPPLCKGFTLWRFSSEDSLLFQQSISNADAAALFNKP